MQYFIKFGLDDLRDLFQPEQFYDSMVLHFYIFCGKGWLQRGMGNLLEGYMPACLKLLSVLQERSCVLAELTARWHAEECCKGRCPALGTYRQKQLHVLTRIFLRNCVSHRIR